MSEFEASAHVRIGLGPLDLREPRREAAITQGLQSWDSRHFQGHHSHSAVPARVDVTGVNATRWRSDISRKICRGPCSHCWGTARQTTAVFLGRGRHVRGCSECQSFTCLLKVFSLVPVSLMLTVMCILNSKCFFSPSFFFPLWLCLSGRSCNSTLCLRLDMSQSVIPKQKKTFIRYKTASLSYLCASIGEFTEGAEKPRALPSLTHFTGLSWSFRAC